jgi:hypothetical protein
MPVREPFVDQRTLAAELMVSVSTVRKWTAEGMPAHRWAKRTIRYRVSEVLAWLEGDMPGSSGLRLVG